MIMSGYQTASRSIRLIILTSLLLCTGFASAQDCNLADAEEHYTFGRFEEALDILTMCYELPDLDLEMQQKVLRLTGMTYIAKERRDEARQAISSLLELVPGYEADPEQDPPPYVAEVEQLKREMDPDYVPPSEREGGSWMKKAAIGTGAAVVGIVVLLSGGDDSPPPPPENNDLPDPPVLP